MTFLSVTTVVCLGLLAGVEFAVSAFVNPVLWQMEPKTQARLVSIFGRNLGGVMSFWYGLNLLLLVATCLVGRHAPGFSLFVAATAIWVAVIVLTLLFLVPLNNRLVALDTDAWTDKAHAEHRRWDARHRYRIVAVVAAFACFALAVLS